MKVRIFRSTCGHKNRENHSIPVADYIVNYYIFGVLMHSVTVYDVEFKVAEKMFKGKEILTHK